MRRTLALLLLTLAACDDMEQQPRYDPYERADLFPDGGVPQPPVPGTIPWEAVPWEMARRPVPPPVTPALLEDGQRGYAAFCAPCHGLAGTGDGMAAGRFVPHPPSFHDDRRRALPPEAIVRVITEGVGRMYAHAHQVRPDRRWAIAWYVKALQRHWPAPPAAAAPPQPVAASGTMTALRRERLEREQAVLSRIPTAADLAGLAGALGAGGPPERP